MEDVLEETKILLKNKVATAKHPVDMQLLFEYAIRKDYCFPFHPTILTTQFHEDEYGEEEVIQRGEALGLIYMDRREIFDKKNVFCYTFFIPKDFSY